MSARFDIHETAIAGLHIILRKPMGDERGWLERVYCAEEMQTLFSGKAIVQINHSYTATRGTVRGLHFQHPPHAEIKLVSCLRGEIYDVAVDLRRDSPTRLQWHGEILSADNHRSLLIPEGFAHGFQTLSDDCELLYLHSQAYQPDAKDGLYVDDPRLAIAWPLPIAGLSPRDAGHALLDDTFMGLTP